MIKFSILFFHLVFTANYIASQISPFINVDQFGYPTDAQKVAVLIDPQWGYNSNLSYNPAATLELRDGTTNLVVFSAPITQWNNGQTHNHSGDRGWWFDFSSVITPGSYYVYDPVNNERSSVFVISDNPYEDVIKVAGRAFYYNRCNSPKLEQYAGTNWTDGNNFLGPLQDANCRYIYDPANAVLEKDLTGGWFDAGDYNKYVTYTYSTLHNLLSAYEESPTVFGDDWNIPESGNGIPDLIDEVKWELDWLIKMTNSDGSVHIKMGSQNHQENSASPPSANEHQRFYGPTCTSASATLASVFAHASIVLGQFAQLTTYAQQLLQIAEQAFSYTLPYFNNNNFQLNCDDLSIVSGDTDRDAQAQIDKMISAAIYIYEATDNVIYNNFVATNYARAKPIDGWYWDAYTRPVQDALLRYTTLTGSDTNANQDIINRISLQANDPNWGPYIGWNDNQDLYRAFVPHWTYHWGSNQAKAEYGNLNNVLADFAIGNQASSRKKAKELLHYFHGVNPQGMVYLSNMYDYGAEKSANEIYHLWFHDATDWDNALSSPFGPAPGFLVGGPNKSFSVSTIVPPSSQPEQKSYKDWNTSWPENSWEITEPAIYYQAAYLRLLARVSYLWRQTLWTGNEDDNWGNLNNWSNGKVPSKNLDIIIPVTTNDPVLDQDRVLGNLTIHADASLTVPPSVGLTIEGNLDNQNGVNGILIQSDPTETGSIIHSQPSVMATMRRYIHTNGWHLLSSPVSDMQIIGSEYAPNTNPLPNNFDLLYFDETVPYNIDNYYPWINIRQEGGVPDYSRFYDFVAGRGYLVRYSSEYPVSQPFSFSGRLNQGNVNKTLNNSSASLTIAGWNLLGNPYPSAINWQLASKTQFQDNFAYVYNPTSGVGGGYEPVEEEVAANQGFFVLTTTEANGQSFTFTDGLRLHGGDWRKNQSRSKSRLTLTLYYGELFDKTQIRVIEGSTPARDKEDALKIFSLNSEMPQLFSHTSDDILVAINTYPSIESNSEVTIGHLAPKTGEYSINLSETTGEFGNQNLYLRDLLSGIIYNLNQTPTITFSSTEGTHNKRFKLYFAKPTTTEPIKNNSILVYGANNRIFIDMKDLGPLNCQIRVLDASGRVLIQKKEIINGRHSFETNLPGGIYFIIINSAKSYKTEKLVIN